MMKLRRSQGDAVAMDYLTRLEMIFAKWYKNVPHLPARTQRWIAENMWWMALVGVVLLVMGLFIVIPLLFAALALTTSVSVVAPYIPYYQDSLGLAWVAFTVNVVSYVVVALLLAVSISHLHAKSKQGWDFVFWSLLVNLMLAVISAVVLYSLSGVLVALVGAAVGAYFLFEVRGQFRGAKTVKEVKHRKSVSKA